MKPSCLAFDFDYTLASFGGNRENFFDLFSDQGVPTTDIIRIYEEMKKTGSYSVANLVNRLMDETDTIFDVDKIYRDHDEWLKQNLRLYPDAEKLKHKLNVPVAIITHGDEQHQKMKIEKTGVKYDHLFVTNKPDSKHKPLRELLELIGGPIVFVDDKATELDAVREAGLGPEHVITHHIHRDDGHYGFLKAKHEHRIITSLDDLI
ncbi:MAG: HAD family hydrolase [Patescibacteria group bacterium]